MEIKKISENKIIKYLFLITVVSLTVFFFRIYVAGDFSLENNPYDINEKAYFDVSAPTLLILSPDVPSLYYYSHGLGFILSIIVGFLLLRTQKGSRRSKLFFAMMSLFCAWLVLDLIQWATDDPVLMLFLWGITVVIEVLFFGIALLIAKHFSDNTKNLSIMIGGMATLAGVVILFIPSVFGLIGVDMETYEVIEGVVSRYLVYLYEFLCLIFIIHIAFKNRRNLLSENDTSGDKFFLLSIALFLVLFLAGNLYGSFSENWTPSQYGLIGMPLLVLLLSYLIQKYNFSNAKVLLAQFLILTLLGFTIANLFIRKIENIRVVVIISIIFILSTGFILIRAVKREIEAKEREKLQHEKFEELAGRFENINHILAHDVKNTLGKTKDMFVELPNGTFGEITDMGKSMSKRLAVDTTDLITSITNILKAGDKIIPNPKPFDFKEAVLDAMASSKDKSEEKKLKIETNIDENQDYTVNADRSLIVQHVLKNLIENAVNYNIQNGSIWINLSKKDPKTLLLVVKDNGHGMTEETKKKLFTAGGHGEDSIKFNVHTSGYGLLIARQTMEAHHGKVDGNSEGKEKGSTFSMELPVDFAPVVSEVPKI
ncbi:hypothetical protein A2W56_02820 [Candidatus Nomurabacteria bacterium RIFCSPHIGHO2_02_41_18]|nr:MAG: hypothetical protein A2W56_02820 [Candidatus Nomurabacteria bacterium RIFCSPHIGHO2_02_41_18]